MTDTLTLTIDDVEVTVPKGSTVMEACTAAGKEIPHFCYHKRLSVAGNCRMCLVEVEGAPKPVASCHWPAAEGMVVKTGSNLTVEARKGTMEMLLVNHPLDCPICDQGGECDLQDQAVAYGSDRTRFHEMKRAVDDKDIGAKIKTVMTRCIHCMRCVRFATEVAGVEEFGATGRGVDTQVGTYVEAALQSELAGNMIDLCPVGALTSRPYAYTARPWELESTPGIDVMDAVGSHIRLDHRAGQVMRVLPRESEAVNEEWISDTARFAYDGLGADRLTTPLVKSGGRLRPVGWPQAFAKLVPVLRKTKADKIAGLAGDLHCAEDLYAFRAFMRETLKTDHFDARGDGALVDGTNPAAYVLHVPLARVAEADAVLLVGCNPRYEAPLLNTRLRQAWQRGAQVASIGPVADLCFPVEDLGNSPHVLEKLLDGKMRFAKALKKAQRPLILVGSGVVARDDGLEVLFHAGLVAEYMKTVREGWAGFGVVQRAAGRVAALDLGVHPTAGGWDTRAILSSLTAGQVELMFLYGDTDVPLERLSGARTTVYIGTHLTEQARQADIVLPAAAYTEKSGLWTNLEGRVQEGQAAVLPPLQAREDWKVFRALSGEMGKALPFDTQQQLRQLIIENCPAYARVGEIVPPAWQPPGQGGRMSDDPFVHPVTKETFYQTNEIMRASATMRACQAESDDVPTAQEALDIHIQRKQGAAA
jgi:NADH-quinone oxidoreductase subunit G